MGKRILQLYVDDEDIAASKVQGINLSRMFRGMIKAELGDKEAMGENKRINALKFKVIKLSSELEAVADRLKASEKRLNDAEGKLKAKQMVDEGWQMKK